jgi:hypothetical protein
MKNQHQGEPSCLRDPTLSEAARRGLKSLELEGIILPDEVIADIRLLDKGEMTHQEFRARAIARATGKDPKPAPTNDG